MTSEDALGEWGLMELDVSILGGLIFNLFI